MNFAHWSYATHICSILACGSCFGYDGVVLGQSTSGGDFGTFDGDMLVIYSIDRRGKLAAVFQVWTRC